MTPKYQFEEQILGRVEPRNRLTRTILGPRPLRPQAGIPVLLLTEDGEPLAELTSDQDGWVRATVTTPDIIVSAHNTNFRRNLRPI